MKRKNTMRNALFTSIISMLLCVSMLVGTTFAWFTDEVVSGMNTIVAGNLDIEVTNADGDITGQKELFDDVTLWEPGVVAYENLTLVNKGTLALKYAMYMNFDGQNYVIEADGTKTNYGLASKLKVAIVPGGVEGGARESVIAKGTEAGWNTLENLAQTGKLYPANNMPTDGKNAETYGLVIYWEPADDDNNWNVKNGKTTTDEKPLHIDLGINVVATQLTYEEDSFNNLYDENSKFDILPQASVSDKDTRGLETIIYDVENKSFDMNTVHLLNLDTAYAFKGESPETAKQNKYSDWFVDFFVALDKAPKAGLMLSGQYESFYDKWVAFEVPADQIEANTFYPLLGYVTGGGVSNWTYVDICEGVGTFNCGALDKNDLNAGTTMTVQLRLINPENTEETIVVRETKYTFENEVAKVGDLQELLADGKDATLTKDISIAKSEAASGNYGAIGVNVNGSTLDGDGNSLGVDKWGTWDSAISITSGTVKNLTVNKGMRGIFINHNGTAGKVYLENVIIDGTVYTISCDQGTNSGLEAKNCTFNGWTSYAATIGDVKFENCSFGAGQGYNYSRPYAPTEYVGCDFAAGHAIDARAAVTFENCTIDGQPLTTANLATLVVGGIANATVK